ncbi:MAG: hypothetical protein AAF721_36120 [Myxococcota bacterium]
MRRAITSSLAALTVACVPRGPAPSPPAAADPPEVARPVPELDAAAPRPKPATTVPATTDLPELDAYTIATAVDPYLVAIADDGAVWFARRDDTRFELHRASGAQAALVATFDESIAELRPEPGTTRVLLGLAPFDDHPTFMTVAVDGTVSATAQARLRAIAVNRSVLRSVGDERWRFDDTPPQVWINAADGNRVVRVDRMIRMVSEVVAADDRLIALDALERELVAIDAQGAARTIAVLERGRFSSRSPADRICVAGDRVAAVAQVEALRQLLVVHRDGGALTPVGEARADRGLDIAACHRGRAALRSKEGLVVLSLPPVISAPATWSAYNDPRALDQLPLRPATRRRLESWGVRSAFDLDNRWFHELAETIDAAPPDVVTELRYALEIAASQRAVASTLAAPPIDAAYLEPVASLGLSVATAGALVAAQKHTLGLLVTLTEAYLLKTRGIDRRQVAVIKAALAKRGMVLGQRWSELGTAPVRP